MKVGNSPFTAHSVSVHKIKEGGGSECDLCESVHVWERNSGRSTGCANVCGQTFKSRGRRTLWSAESKSHGFPRVSCVTQLGCKSPVTLFSIIGKKCSVLHQKMQQASSVVKEMHFSEQRLAQCYITRGKHWMNETRQRGTKKVLMCVKVQ